MPLLVPEDSPLRNPPADMHPDQKVAFDAVRYALDATHLAWVRLQQNLTLVMQRFESGSTSVGESATYAMADAWTVVDNLWRVHNVLRQIPNYKRPPELEAHLRALAAVEDLRHDLQHIEKRLKRCAADGIPLWGTLSWFWTPDEDPLTRGKVYMLVPGAIRDGRCDLVNPIGRRFHRPIGLVTLMAFQKQINLSDCLSRIRGIATGLDSQFRQALGDVPRGGGDVVVAMDIMLDATSVISAPREGA